MSKKLTITIITCCQCAGQYALSLYSDSSGNFYTKCPYCEFVHSVIFDNVRESKDLVPKGTIRLKDWYPAVSGSRIANASRVDQSGSDGGDVTNWTIGDDFIFCIMMYSNTKDTVADALRLDWRNVTDSGTFAPLTGSGELITSSAGGTLSNGTAVTSAEAICTIPATYTYQNTNQGECTDGTPACIAFTNPASMEMQIGVGTSNALANKLYEFQLYSTTQAVIVQTPLGSTITMAAAAATNVVLNVIVNA